MTTLRKLKSKQDMYSQKMQLASTAKNATSVLANKEQINVEKDSGVYDPSTVSYSASRRGSVSSSGCPSGCSGVPVTVSPNTTSSSAYSSAASTCSETEVLRKKSLANSRLDSNKARRFQMEYVERVPFHPQITNHRPSSMANENVKNTTEVAASFQHRRHNGGFSPSFVKSENSPDSGRKLHDHVNNKIYEKKRMLGKGGFARVYEVVEVNQQADSSSSWSPLAAKVIDKSRISRTNQREKVDIEIELLAEACGHPNVIGYLDSFEEKNYICILLELCNKKSLAQYLRRKQYLSEEEVCDIMRQIVSGLTHLHSKGIIHRDLKLGNILLTDSMQVKIADFGLATRMEWGRKKTICGTPNFIAPEVLQREGHGPEADIWALGCMFFTLLVGKPPFETSCLRDTYRCILKNSYRIPSTVSPEAADLIRCMLRHKPKSRPTLSEISSHQFFKKHSHYLDSIHRPSYCSKFEYEAKQNENDTSSQSSEEKSLTQIASGNTERSVKTEATTTADKLSSECRRFFSISSSMTQNSRSPLRSFTSLLQKKLGKKSSPKKETSESFQAITSTKGKPLFPKTDSNHNLTCVNVKNQTPKTFVSKWVDYSNRYGFGYQLSSGKICVLFNEGKHISLSRDGKIIEYVASETANAISFPIDAVPPCLAKHSAILMSFTSYMNKNLCHSNDEASSKKVEDEVRLLTWCRTDQYVAMYFNDGTFQVNFTADHVKISVSSLHSRSAMGFTLVDEERNAKFMNRNEFIAQVDSDIIDRLSLVHQQFHNFFDVRCLSHPFCGLCKHVGCHV